MSIHQDFVQVLSPQWTEKANMSQEGGGNVDDESPPNRVQTAIVHGVQPVQRPKESPYCMNRSDPSCILGSDEGLSTIQDYWSSGSRA